jgi:hypothetical protein
VQAAGCDAVLDLIRVETNSEKLHATDDAVLDFREPPGLGT